MMDGVVGKATIFGILTATRVQEFCMAEWKEIDFQRRVWSIPPERRKDGKDFPHQVPLSRQAVELLLSLRRRAKEIFPGYEKEYISLDSPRVSLQSIIIRKAKKPPVTMHGCRSTFRDWAAEKMKRYCGSRKVSYARGWRQRLSSLSAERFARKPPTASTGLGRRSDETL